MEIMKDAYLYKFREDGREYQLIIAVGKDRKLQIVDSKRLGYLHHNLWMVASPCETDEFRKIDSKDKLSVAELEKLAEAGIALK